MNLNYEELAEAIASTEYDAYEHEQSVKDIRERLNYLISQLDSAKQYLPCEEGGSELEYALGDIDNLLTTILFKI